MNAFDTDVLVAGAGTTGLALALQAHDHGARVRVVERRDEPFRPSRALLVHPRTLEVLRPLGVVDALLARGDPCPAVRLHLGRRQMGTELGHFPIADTAFPHLLLEGQATVEAVLSDALATRGIEVERGRHLVEVRPQHEGAVARITGRRGDDLVTCRYVAGCDGPASTVRRATGIGWRGGTYRQEVVLADAELEGDLVPGAVHAVAARGGLLFLFPLGERATWRLLATRAGHGAGTPGQPDGPVPIRDLQTLIDAAGLQIRISEMAWSALVPLQHRVATRYRAGPLFLAGDAAHVHSPAGGQGMNTGIQDATNLGWKLAFSAQCAARGRAVPEALLDSYEAERRGAARRVVVLTHLLFWGEAGLDPVASFARAILVPAAAPVLPFLLRRRYLMAEGVRVLSQLRLRYRRSPVCWQGQRPARSAAAAGRRLADAGVIVEGRRYRLHQLIARPGVHLLLEGQAPPLSSELCGPHCHVHLVESWPGQGVVAVRPDGYVGYTSVDTDADEIRSWLTTVGADQAA